MAAKKNVEQNAQNDAQNVLEVKAYKVLGERFESKDKAKDATREAHKKGFKSAGLCVRGGKFVLLFGTYATAAIARANLAAVQTAGFTAEIETI